VALKPANARTSIGHLRKWSHQDCSCQNLAGGPELGIRNDQGEGAIF
jgi:hypothetical protein